MNAEVYHWDWSNKNDRRKSTLREYQKHESFAVVLSHVNEGPDGKYYWLETYGMDSWAIVVKTK